MKRSSGLSFQGFRSLSYSQKFAVITLVFLIPVFAFTPLIFDQITNISRYGVSELDGTIYLRSLWNFSEQVRDYATAVHQISNQETPLSDVQTIQSKVDTSLEDFLATDRQFGDALDTANQASSIQQQWEDVKASVQREDWTAFESRQAALFDSIAALTSLVGDSSYLILDPSLDTYYMMDTVLIKAPENQALIFEAHRLAEQSLRQGSFSVEDRSVLIVMLGRLEANLDTMNRNINVAIENDQTAEMQPIIATPLETYNLQLRAFTNLLNTHASNPNLTATMMQELDTAYEQVHAADSFLYQAASESLELGIQHRIRTLQQRLIWMAVIALVSVLTAFFIGRSMMKSISQPLSDLIGATKLLSAGNMSGRVTVEDPGEVGQVGIAFNQMAEELERDKQSLIARTAELAAAQSQSEKRARNIQTVNEIARIISSEHSLDILLPLIARVVSEKLGFYHVGVFLLDHSRTFAILQAANSDEGQALLTQGYRFKAGSPGIVSAAISSGKPQVVADVSKYGNIVLDALPKSRSEVALPIRLSGELIGALDIQSVDENAFTWDDVEAFEVLSSQLGIAIQNARLYEENVQALKDTEEAYRRLSGSSWGSMVQQLDVRAFAYDGVSSHPVADPQPSQKMAALSVPIRVRGQVIGHLRLNPLDPNRNWTEDDVAITNAVAERAALALEAARLLEEAQRRASRETFLSEMASKLSTSFQLDSILRDTVEELGQTLKNSTVSFQLVNPSAPSNGEKKDDSFARRNGAEQA